MLLLVATQLVVGVNNRSGAGADCHQMTRRRIGSHVCHDGDFERICLVLKVVLATETRRKIPCCDLLSIAQWFQDCAQARILEPVQLIN